MNKNPNNPNCACDQLDEDILDEDGYTCYSCYDGGEGKVPCDACGKKTNRDNGEPYCFPCWDVIHAQYE